MPRLPRISAESRLALPSIDSVDPLDLLVVLELGLEQPHHLDREAGGAGDADAGVLVGREDLLDVALGDDVAHRGAPVAGHHHAAGERRGHDRRAVRRQVGGAAPGQARRAGSRSGDRWPGSRRSDEVPGRQEGVGQSGVARASRPPSSLAALLDERLHEVLGVGLEDVVDLVEDRVDVLVELLLALGDVGLGRDLPA